MSDTKISAYPSASSLTGAERLPVSQSNQTRGATAAQILSSDLFTQSGSGTVARSLNSKLGDTVSVFDFFTTAQIADVQARTALVDVGAAIATAITSIPASGGTIYFPRGIYAYA